jgi:hypothetical protein
MKRINRSTLLYPRSEGGCAHLYNETWRFNVYVYWPVDDTRMLQILKNWDYDGPPPQPVLGGRTYSFTDKKAGRISIILLHQWDGGPRHHAILAHEALHAVIDQFAYRGIPINADNDEPVAYTIEWLIESVLSAIARTTKRRA